VRYPARWRLSVPSAALALDITPRQADQELNVGTRYWEGAVSITGSAGQRRIAGQGYVELVGYGER
jgi:predicted secreted hydrolase